MTDDRIAEAEKVLARYEDRSSKPNPEHLADAVRRLLAVLREHAPTDDEYDALTRVILDATYQATAGECRRAASAVLAAGFRRSEVPEPSAEEWAERVNAAREKAIAKGYTAEHDAKHGVRHLLRWAIDYSRRGKAEDSSGLVAAAIDLAEIAYAELERLRHVADTMRAVSEALRTRYASDSQAAYFMREIDAALEAVPEPQGEPSDAQAALRAWRDYWDRDEGGNDEEAMRAALRAAGVVGQEGEKR